MTHSRQLGSKLLSLLLAFAMILALMPAVSFTASAAGTTYRLEQDKPLFSNDGWAWDGSTLHFFGSGTYNVDSPSYFSIESSKGPIAFIDISSSLNVNFTCRGGTFITSINPLIISGMGKITADTSTTDNTLISSEKTAGNITYTGGAICTDSDMVLFNTESFEMRMGHIEAPNAYIAAIDHTIYNSYVNINSFSSFMSITDNSIDINQSFVDTQSLLNNSKNGEAKFKLTNSVLRSAAGNDEFTANTKPNFSTLDASVIYLPNVDSIDWTVNTILANVTQHEVINGSGYAFCTNVMSNIDNNDPVVTYEIDSVSGTFLDYGTDQTVEITSIASTGGSCYSTAPLNIGGDTVGKCSNMTFVASRSANSQASAAFNCNNTLTKCTVVGLSDSGAFDNVIELGNANNLTSIDGRESYFYAAGKSGILVNMTNVEYTYSTLSAPAGRVTLQLSGSRADLQVSITAGSLGADRSISFYGDICADKLDASSSELSISGDESNNVAISDTNNTKIWFSNQPSPIILEKQADGKWGLDTNYYSYDKNREKAANVYIGSHVFNDLAEPDKEYSDLDIYRGPTVINVPLFLPYDEGIYDISFVVSDISQVSQTYDCDDIGLSYKVTAGEGNSLNLILSASGDTIESGPYMFRFAVNGQAIQGDRDEYVYFYLSENLTHAMTFNDHFFDWTYTDRNGITQAFTTSNMTDTVYADTWTWYGSDDADTGYKANTLVLNDGFNFSTSNDYGISVQPDVTVVVNGNCTINAGKEAIHTTSDLNIIKGDNANSKLTVNNGIVSNAALTIKGVDIESTDFIIGSGSSSNTRKPLLSGTNIFLNNSKITADDSWKDDIVINATKKLTISRGVTLDLPASTINSNNTIIADLDSVNNIQSNGSQLNAADSPFGSESGLGTLSPVDNTQKMTLSSKAFKFIGETSDIVIEDTDSLGKGSNSLIGGQRYKLDLSELISAKYFNILTAEYQLYRFSIERDNEKTYLVVDVPDNATDSPITPTISFIDNAFDYSSHEIISFTPTIGKVVKAEKIGFYCQGNYDIDNPCYISSATCNGRSLKMQGTFPNNYYLVPSGEEVEITLVPEKGYMIDSVSLMEWKVDGSLLKNFGLSPSGTYTITADGTDKQLVMDINYMMAQQYYKVDIADSLRQDISDGKINSVVLIYSDGTEKTVDNTNVDDFPAYVLKDKPIQAAIGVPTDSNGEPLTTVKSINNLNASYKSNTQRYTTGYFRITKDTVISAEYDKLPENNATVTVNCGEHGTVTPSTAAYPIGTEVTLTVTPDNGYKVKSATLDGRSVRLTNGKYTFTVTADCVFSVEFQKQSTGGGSGGYSGGTDTKDPEPSLNGVSRSWSEIASELSKMDMNSRVNIDMNGSTTIPADVLKQIKDKKISADFKFDAYKSWTIDGSNITSDTLYADLTLLPETSSVNGARGVAGYRFSTGGNNVDAMLNVQFKNEYAGKFANLYLIKDGKAEFVSTAKISGDGSVTLPGASAKGEYVVMLCDYSDLYGDVNNDGVLNVLDVSAILKDIVGIAKCANAQMGDLNGDGTMNAVDASEILRKIVL